MKFNTQLLHGSAVRRYDQGATLPPLFQSNAFSYPSARALEEVFAHRAPGFAYSRVGNPTASDFAQRVNELEGGAGAVPAASGMAAITMALLCILSPGDELIAGSDLYGGTLDLFGTLERLGIRTRFVRRMTPEEIAPLVSEHTRAVFGEVISNPALQVMDVARCAACVHALDLPLIVDSTTATPYLVRPLSLGADVVVHSSSKYITGCGSAISGVVVDGGRFVWNFDRYPALRGYERYGKLAFQARLRTELLENFGACLSPANAFLNVLGLETLGLRMERICSNALALAEALGELVPTHYPALPGDADNALCRGQFRGLGGGILTFRAGTRQRSAEILDGLRYAAIASNIGDVRTLALPPPPPSS